ncbi:hypothetical protein ACAN107058_14680 [Paracidovorax anthurii]
MVAAAGSTVCARVAELLAATAASPGYTAVSPFSPSGNAEVVSVAKPCPSTDAVPSKSVPR